jgi:hypothetical protein
MADFLFTVGMRKKEAAKELKISEQERQLIEQLRQHPEIKERVQSILAITTSADGRAKRADEVEGLLIDEMRHLGNATMSGWATGEEKRQAEQLRAKDNSARVRKKKR